MTLEIPTPEASTPEGAERLRHPKLLWIGLQQEERLPDQILFLSLGSFTLTLIDPHTGEMIYDADAARSIHDTKIICLYPPNANEGDQIFIQMETRLEGNLVERSGAVYVFRDQDWHEGRVGKAELVDLRLIKSVPPNPLFSFFFPFGNPTQT